MKPKNENKSVLEFTVLGSGTCAVTRKRSCASYALRCHDQLILMDMGFGSLRRLTEASIDYRHVDMILITHEHLDHSGDLAPFLMALHHTPGFTRRKPLTLIGPQGFNTFLTRCRDLYGDWLLESETFDLAIHEMNLDHLNINQLSLETWPMYHSRPTVGYRIEYQNRVLAYSGDTGRCPNILSLNHDADLSILECSFPDNYPVEYHLTPMQAGEIASKSGCKQLLLTHLYPMMDDIDIESIIKTQYSGAVSVAYDLERIYL